MSTSKTDMRYFTSCVNWPREDVHAKGGLCDMISEAINVTRQTFIRRVHRGDRIELERNFGYAPHCEDSILTMARDYAVTYHRSKLHGLIVYYIRHSAIEYVFTS